MNHITQASLSVAMRHASVAVFTTNERKLSSDNEIIKVLNNLVIKHHHWGFPKYFKWLRKMGYSWNHKRVYRVYTELKLKTKKRLPNRNLLPLVTPKAKGKYWSIDFMSDSLHNKSRFRTLNVIDDFNHEVLGIDIALACPQ